MNSVERVAAALQGQQPDRVPVVEFLVDEKIRRALFPQAWEVGAFSEAIGLDAVSCGFEFRWQDEKADSYRDLEVYQGAFELQQQIFETSKAWPKSELYALTDQIRRASRSVGACLAESWPKRRYPAHFLSKLTDADSENQATLHWLRTPLACGYVSEDEASQLAKSANLVGKQLGTMINHHESFCFGEKRSAP